MEKSHVTLERHLCQVCAKAYDTGAILLDRRLKPVFERNTVTDIGMCPDCDKLDKDGYIALVGVDPDRSTHTDGLIKLEDAYRTGNIAHLKRDAAKLIFNVSEERINLAMWFVENVVIEQLAELR